MASSYSTTGSHLDRKALKRPDKMTAAISQAMSGLFSNTGRLSLIIGGFVSLGILVALVLNHQDAKSDAARNALYLADKAMEAEIKNLTPAKPASEAGKKTPGKPVSEDSLAFKKMDVDSQFSDSTKKLKAIDQDFGNTRAAFEARLRLAEIYFEHGEYAKALPWYVKAAEFAPDQMEKALTISSQGYVYENLGKPTEALQAFQKALNLGEGGLKGDLLLGVARCYEALHDSANARSTYDKILTELPNTEYSKSAEVYKSQLL